MSSSTAGRATQRFGFKQRGLRSNFVAARLDETENHAQQPGNLGNVGFMASDIALRPVSEWALYGRPTGGGEEMGCYKRAIFKAAITGTLAMVSLGMVLVAEALAGCGNLEGHKAGAIQPQSWQRTGQFRPGSLLLVADRDDSVDRIVGFWKVKLVSEGNPGIPDGTVIDDGFTQWHPDGTEILNSSRPAASSNFCLGIWKKTEKFHYTLNHFTLSSDPTNDTLSSRGQLREEIDLDHGGDEYFGTFTIDDYDLSGHLLVHLRGTVHATRITVNTHLADVL